VGALALVGTANRGYILEMSGDAERC